MEDKPSLSIIIPVYNALPWIDRCVKSAIKSYSGPLDVICVDDGSDDGSSDVLDDMARNDPRVKVIHQDNRGRSAARNAGMDSATGEWVGFLDADDCMLEGSLDAVLTASCSSISMICTLMEVSASATHGGRLHFNDYISLNWKQSLAFTLDPRDVSAGESCGVEDCKCLAEQKPLCRSAVFTKLFRLDCIRQHKIIFVEGLRFGEDTIFVFDYLSRAQGEVMFSSAFTHTYNVSSPGTIRTYRNGDFDGLSKTGAAWCERAQSSIYGDIIALRVIFDLLFMSVRAANVLGLASFKKEIGAIYKLIQQSEILSHITRYDFKRMNSRIWFLWYMGVMSFKHGCLAVYWVISKAIWTIRVSKQQHHTINHSSS